MQDCHGKSSFQQEASFHQQIAFTFKEETSRVAPFEYCFVRCWEWTLRKVDQKYLESFEMWCWEMMDISWTDHVRNAEVLQRAEEGWNILHTI